MNQNEAFVFTEEVTATPITDNVEPWKILVIDDDHDILKATKRILSNFVFEQRKMLIITGTSGAEAKKLIAEHADTAVIFLDVIMESDDAGLQVVNHIRNTLLNASVRILLRTGQAGQFDDEQVFEEYDVNDFLEKAELTGRRLKNALKIGLRGFRMQQQIEQNVIQEKALRKSADAANIAKGEFLANMSHEIRSPMTSIKGGLTVIQEVLLDTEASEEDKSDALKAIGYAVNSSNRLMTLLDEILDLAKLESGHMTIDIKPANLSALINLVQQEISLLLSEKSLTLVLPSYDGVNTTLAMDFGKITQVLIILLNNAVKFFSSGGQITISIQATSCHMGV